MISTSTESSTESSTELSTEEMVDIVDENNGVVKTVPRPEMVKHKLRHRCTFFLIFNSAGEILVSKRTKTKDLYPGLYEIPAGTVSAGETYEENARRELKEEFGIVGAEIEYLFDLTYEDDFTNHISKVFRCVFDGKIKLQKEEVEEYFFITLDELKKMVEERREEFCPDRIPLLKKYFDDYLGDEFKKDHGNN